MNLKGFKKVQDDDEKAILKNKKGHSIILAKKILSKAERAELEKLPLYAADGNDGEPIPSQDTAPAAPVEQSQQPQYVQGNPSTAPDDQAPEVPSDKEIAAAPMQAGQPQQAQTFQQAYDAYNTAHQAEFGKEDAAFAQDLANGHIKPETYRDLFANKDTVGKVGTLFGLLVSGAGSGLAHQPNAVLQMMNDEINRDLEAQKQSKANAQNFYRLNQQNELNKAQVGQAKAQTAGIQADTLIKADTHTKNQMLIALAHDNLNNVNKMPPGPQKAQALQTLNGMGQAIQSEIQQNNIKGASALASNPEGDFQQKQKSLRTMGMLGMEGASAMADANEAHHMPGFGESTNPVPADVRSELIAKQEYDQAAKNYVQFAKENQANWANINPKQRLAIAKEGAVLGAELQGKYRMKTHGGVFKTGEQEYIQSIIPDNATSWASSFNQIPKVEQTIKNNSMDTKTLASGYGLPIPDQFNISSKQVTNPKYHPQSEGEQKPSKPEGAEKFSGGKWWKKGPKGEAIEVK